MAHNSAKSTGLVCPAPCESECNRHQVDGPVSINKVERSIGDFGIERKLPLKRLTDERRPQKVAVVGGAQILDQKGFFNIGKRNHMAVRKIFWKNKVMTNFEEVGGNVNRTIRLELATGNMYLKVAGKEARIL